MPLCARWCDITGLSRSVWVPTPAIAWMWFSSLIVFVVVALAQGPGDGARDAVAVFLGWAIVREIMPRGALVAFLVPFVSAAFVVPAGETNLAACFGVLLAARVVSGTVGRTPTLIDCGLLVIFSGWIAQRAIGLPVAIVLGAALLTLRTTRTRVAGVMCIAVALWVGNDAQTLGVVSRAALTRGDTLEQVAAVVVLIAAVIALWPLPTKLRITDDKKRARLRGGRVTAARLVVAAALVAAIIWEGLVPGLFGLGPAAGALVATALVGGRLRAAKIDWVI